MPSGKRQEFDDFIEIAQTDADIWRWLQNEGFSVSLSAITTWKRSIAPTGAYAIEMKNAAAKYAGIDPLSTLSAVEGSAIQLAETIRQKIVISAVEEMNASEVGMMKLIPALMREARAAAADKQRLKYTKDRAALEMAGAQRLADILMRVFEDTPMEEPVKEAIDGGLAQVESESEDRF